MTEEEPEEGDTFGELMPPEDRLWRHPSEVATPAAVTASGFRQTLGVAAVSALGGGLIVAGLWLTLGSINTASVSPTTLERIQVQPIAAPSPTDAEWATVVGASAADAVASVEIEIDGEQYTIAAIGYRRDGLLITSAAAVAGAETLTVLSNDGRRLSASIVGADPTTDTAVLQVDAEIEVAVLGPDHDGPVGQRLAVVGPARHTAETHIATAAMRVEGEGDVVHGLIGLAPSEVVEPGAAIVDETGAVVGFLNGLRDRGDPTATPIGAARRVAVTLADGLAVEHAWLGIEGADRAHDEMGQVATVTRVDREGPADIGGLEVDDIVVGVGGADISSMDELIAQLRRYGPGDEIRLDYMRDGDRWWCQVVLGTL